MQRPQSPADDDVAAFERFGFDIDHGVIPDKPRSGVDPGSMPDPY
jgi:hypothetical protein